MFREISICAVYSALGVSLMSPRNVCYHLGTTTHAVKHKRRSSLYSTSREELEPNGSYINPATRSPHDGADDASTLDMLWSTQGAFLAQSLPLEPSSELFPEDVITSLTRGLQYNDIPKVNSGLIRCYEFMDLACKKLVTGHGNVPEERTLEKFLEYAADSPKIAPFMGAASIEYGDLVRIAGTPTRGEIVSMPVRVRASVNNPIMYDSGFARDAYLSSGVAEPQTFVVRLQKQRRPPLSGAYVVTDVVDTARVSAIVRPLNLEGGPTGLPQISPGHIDSVPYDGSACDT